MDNITTSNNVNLSFLTSLIIMYKITSQTNKQTRNHGIPKSPPLMPNKTPFIKPSTVNVRKCKR